MITPVKGYKTAYLVTDFCDHGEKDILHYHGQLYFSTFEKAEESIPRDMLDINKTRQFIGLQNTYLRFRDKKISFLSIISTVTVEEDFDCWDFVPENY